MAHHVWSVLCYKASIDYVDNSVSLLDTVENVTTREPAEKIAELEKLRKEAEKQGAEVMVPFRAQLVTWWVRSDYGKPESALSRVRIIPPTGKRFEPQEVAIHLEEKTGHRQRIQYSLLPFRGFGVYWISVELKSGSRWRRVAKIPFDLVAAPEMESGD